MKKEFTVLAGFIILAFAAGNIAMSQNISSLMSGVLREERPAVFDYLKKIKTTPEFENEFAKYKNIYGGSIDDSLFATDKKRLELINLLEQMLEKNPKSRDILYSLYLLYDREGQSSKALYYLEQAKEVDPNIN